MATSFLHFLRPKLEVILDFSLSYSPLPVQQEIMLALASEDVRNPTSLYHLHCYHCAPSHNHLCVNYWNNILTGSPPSTLFT